MPCHAFVSSRFSQKLLEGAPGAGLFSKGKKKALREKEVSMRRRDQHIVFLAISAMSIAAFVH